VIRPYRDGDEVSLADVFKRSILEIGPARYNARQVRVWSDGAADAAAWRKRMMQHETFVAQERDVVVGWIELATDGHIDMLYCVPEVTRTGIADELYAKALARAEELHLQRLFAEASLFAESFFLRHGWSVDGREVVVRSGVAISRARMSVLL
jgi:putative acetyltransferase